MLQSLTHASFRMDFTTSPRVQSTSPSASAIVVASAARIICELSSSRRRGGMPIYLRLIGFILLTSGELFRIGIAHDVVGNTPSIMLNTSFMIPPNRSKREWSRWLQVEWNWYGRSVAPPVHIPPEQSIRVTSPSPSRRVNTIVQYAGDEQSQTNHREECPGRRLVNTTMIDDHRLECSSICLYRHLSCRSSLFGHLVNTIAAY